MENDLISIVVPVYNVEKYLRRCLESIQKQTYRNLEIILVDDGSTDDSGNICEQIADSDKRIKVIHKENGGLSDARNVGMQYATGAYVAFVDSDDYIAESMIACLYDICVCKQTEIAICKSKKTTLDKEKGVIHQDREIEIFTNVQALEQLFYQKKYNMSAWGKLYKRSLFEGIFYPKGELYEDVNTTYKVIDRASRVGYCGEQLYFYFVNPKSITRNKFHKGKMAYLRHMEEVLAYIEAYHPELLKAARFRYLWANIHIWVHMPIEQEYEGMEREVRQNIRRYRREVLMDTRIGLKNWVIVLMTYGGHRVMKSLYQIAG